MIKVFKKKGKIMKRKKKLLTKTIAVILSIFIVVATLEISGLRSFAEGNENTIYASDIKKKTSKHYKYYKNDNALFLDLADDVVLVMDEDLELSRINYTDSRINTNYDKNRTLTIKGDKKLTVNGEACFGYNYIQENGTNIYVNGNMIVSNTAVIKSGANLTIVGGSTYYYALSADNGMTTAGNLKITADVDVCNGIDTADLNVTGGEINVNGGIHATNIYISGGNVYSTGYYSSLSSGNEIQITGGYVEAHLTGSYDYAVCVVAKKVTTVDPVYIKTDMNLEVRDYGAWGMSHVTGLMDDSGKTPTDVIFANKELEAKAAEEEAAKKAAEEAATKKAAEEEAAKKAAEEAATKKAAEEAAAKKAAEEASANKAAEGSATKKAAEEAANNTVTYNNEWVNGQWYGSNGDTSYTAQGSWKCNSTGWWFEDTAGWYPQNQWVKIDGKWYYFLDSGYMDYSEYRDGYWLGADGAWVEGYENGTWHVDSTGWWFEDNGWYPSNQYLWINGTKYWFNANGYME